MLVVVRLEFFGEARVVWKEAERRDLGRGKSLKSCRHSQYKKKGGGMDESRRGKGQANPQHTLACWFIPL